MPLTVCYMLCRENHHFVTAPNARLLRKILSLCSSRMVAAESALDIASKLASGQLRVPLEDLAHDATEMERALEAANTLVDVLEFASSQLDDLTKAGHRRCASSNFKRFSWSKLSCDSSNRNYCAQNAVCRATHKRL